MQVSYLQKEVQPALKSAQALQGPALEDKVRLSYVRQVIFSQVILGGAHLFPQPVKAISV